MGTDPKWVRPITMNKRFLSSRDRALRDEQGLELAAGHHPSSRVQNLCASLEYRKYRAERDPPNGAIVQVCRTQPVATEENPTASANSILGSGRDAKLAPAIARWSRKHTLGIHTQSDPGCYLKAEFAQLLSSRPCIGDRRTPRLACLAIGQTHVTKLVSDQLSWPLG